MSEIQEKLNEQLFNVIKNDEERDGLLQCFASRNDEGGEKF